MFLNSTSGRLLLGLFCLLLFSLIMCTSGSIEVNLYSILTYLHTYLWLPRLITFGCHARQVGHKLIFIRIQIKYYEPNLKGCTLNEQFKRQGLALCLHRIFLSFKGTFGPHHTETHTFEHIQREQALHTQCRLSSFSLTVLIVKAVEI